jgi:hypothetical protein
VGSRELARQVRRWTEPGDRLGLGHLRRTARGHQLGDAVGEMNRDLFDDLLPNLVGQRQRPGHLVQEVVA